MVNKRFWLGMLVLTLVFGMTVVGCEGEQNTSKDISKETPNTILSVTISLGADNDTPKVGSSLSAEVKTSKENTYGVSYQWKRGTYIFENISGATSRWYTPTVEDTDKYIKVEVKNSDTTYPIESSAVGPVVDARPGKTPSYPTNRVSNTNLGVMTSSASGWRTLLTSIESTGDYINLDLSACTMSGTSFNPDYTVETGKKYIVSIILPTIATSIEAGSFAGYSAFKNFSNIISVSGENIITIGDFGFSNTSGGDKPLSVNFPKVTTIGQSAFLNRHLSTLNIPNVTNIKASAFADNSSTTDLTITMGNSAPNLGIEIFGTRSYYDVSRTVKVKIPTGATGYSPAASPFTGTSVTVSGTTSTSNWGNGFRGMGWDGTSTTTTTTDSLNQKISLTIEQQ